MITYGKTLLFLFISASLISACGTTKFYTVSLTNIPNTETGTIYLQSAGLGKSANEAYNNAAKRAFEAVLFKGVPGSVQPDPMIENEQIVRDNYPDVVKCFSMIDCYDKFVAYSEKVNTPVKTKDGLYAVLKIKINLRKLRTYLVENKVVRRFGL